MDQNEIDALLGGTPDPEGEGAPPGGEVPKDEAVPGDSGEATPAAEDVQSTSGEASEAEVTSDGTADGDSSAAPDAGFSSETGFSQADIDALMSGAEGAAGEGGAGAPEKDAPAAVGLDSEGKPLDELGAAMAAAIEEEKAAAEAAGDTEPSAPDPPVEDVELPTFDQEELASAVNQPISLLHDVELHVKIELGRTSMFVEDVLRLGEGSVVELDRLAGDPVDVYVNNRLVARGEVLVLNDNFCVRVSEIVSEAEARLAG